MKDFIWVMVYTGLRISDVGLFHTKRLQGNEVFLRAKKNGGEVFAYVPDGSPPAPMRGPSAYGRGFSLSAHPIGLKP